MMMMMMMGGWGGYFDVMIIDIFYFQITPRCFLIGHSGSILALAYVKLNSSSLDLIVSSSENG